MELLCDICVIYMHPYMQEHNKYITYDFCASVARSVGKDITAKSERCTT